MRKVMRIGAADVVLLAVAAVVVALLGGGLGVAAARVQGGSSPHAPLRAVIGFDEPPALNRDRRRLSPPRG